MAAVTHTHGRAEERSYFGRCGCCERRTVDPFNRSCRGCCPDCHNRHLGPDR